MEVLHEGKGQLICCGQPMQLLEEKIEEQGMEKHLPVIEKINDRVKVRIGSTPHPMETNHYIEWTEIITKDGVIRRFLSPGMAPEAEFEVKSDIFQARAYCNIHGLWVKKEV